MRIIRRKSILQKFGITNATLYNWIREGLFPRPGRIGNTVFWDEDEVAEVIAKRLAERPQEQQQQGARPRIRAGQV
jgi:predicted DNA-binding transcriptional regulator AlpA